MDRISRAGIVASAAFLLALVSGVAGAVAIPPGPDNVNLHASQGIDFTSRASQWEFQQAGDRLQARGGFGIGGKGMGAVGGVLRSASAKQLAGGLLRAGGKALGGWGGAAVFFAPYVWDALKQAWVAPGEPGPGEMQSLMPSPVYPFSEPWIGATAACSDLPAQGPLSPDTWVWRVASPASPGSGWGRIGSCQNLDGTLVARWQHVVTRYDVDADCYGSPNAVVVLATGKCGRVGSGRVVSDAELETKAEQNMQSNPGLMPEAADYGMANGGFDTDAPYTTGPAHVDGPTTTKTTTTDAGVRTETSTNSMDLAYAGTDVYVTDSTTTTTTDEAGNTSTKTETNTATGGQTPPKNDPPPPVDVCVEHPDASGCAPLGDAGDAPDLPVQDVPVTFGYASVDAACPAPETFTVFGRTYSFDWAPACTYARALRPVVIALALLSALLFVVKVGRG